MRPISLYLEGYGSYANPTEVDLAEVSLAAIVGANGSGKSTLLDSILWAAYGRGRVGGDADAVISQGSDHARVSYEFDLDGVRWRITRTRTRGKRATALLEVVDADAPSGWSACCEPNVRAGDEAIRNLLGMSVETFLATVLVAQGDADRFCSADPAERKEVLAEVLSLGRYQALAEQARGRVGEARARTRAAESRANELAEEAGSVEELRQDLDAAEEEHERTREAREEAAEQLTAAKLAAQSAESDARALEKARAELRQLQRQVELRATRARQVVEGAPDATRQAEQSVQRAEEAVRRSSRAAEVAPKLTERAQEASSEADGLEEELAELVERGTEARDVQGRVEGAHERLLATQQELVERREGLNRAASSGEASCWVCDQPLTPAKATAMLDELDGQDNQIALELIRSAEAVKHARDEVGKLREQHRNSKDQLQQLRGRAQDLLLKAQQASGEAGLVEERRLHLSAARREQDQLRAAVEEAERTLEALDDDPEVGKAAEAVSELEERTDLEATTAAVRDTEEALGRAVAAEKDADVHHGSLRTKLAVAQRAAEQHAKALEDFDRERGAERDWGQVSRAFGRDGVPALVIAGVVPELEAQANGILEALSAGQLQLRLATSKTTKSGTERQTLEVAVLSPEGERPYESFSGGERLRVDLAIRVGLARLLAHRSGTQMRTLVIDESWGALDTDGVGALADCLRLLHESGEFSAVYTVTHSLEVAELLPSRISVSRDTDGCSVVEITAA